MFAHGIHTAINSCSIKYALARARRWESSVILDLSREGKAPITAWLEVQVLPGPPRILVLTESSPNPATSAELAGFFARACLCVGVLELSGLFRGLCTLVSWVDDGGSMPILDGRMRGIRSIRERDFYSGKSGAGPISTVCSHQLVVQSNRNEGCLLGSEARAMHLCRKSTSVLPERPLCRALTR